MADPAFWENDKTTTEAAFWEKDSVVSGDWWKQDKETDPDPVHPRAAEMASAMRHTLGVVGRAVKATEFALANKPIGDSDSYETQLADAGLTAEQAEGVTVWERGKQVWYPSKEEASAALSGQMDKAIAAADEFKNRPLVTLPRADLGIFGPSQANAPTGLKVAAGAYNAAKSLPEFFTTELGAGLLASGGLPAAIQRIIAAGFVVDMTSHTPEQIAALSKAVESKDPQAIAETATALGMTGVFIGAAGKHALTKPKTLAEQVGDALGQSIKKTEFVDPKIAALRQVAPLTAEAVAKVAPEPTPELKPGDAFKPEDLAKPAEPEPFSPTPLTTEAVAKVVEKEPVVTPAPTPAAVAGESGSRPAPVTAGVEPPAKLEVAQTGPVAKQESERPLTTVPEHLRPAKSTQAILDSQPATPPPEGGLKTDVTPAPEGGAVFGIGGRRTPPVQAVGVTPRQDPNWLRIPSALRRVGRGLFTEGARAVLGRTRNQVGQELSRATRRHVDVEQELFGMHDATIRTAVRAIPRQRLDAALTEASQHVRETQNGRPAPALSADAQSLLDSWFAVGRSTGDIARSNNVQVFDPALGRHRNMGIVPDYIPRMFTAEVEAVLRDPKTDPVLFNRLAQEIATQRGIPLTDAAAELRGVAGRFQANDYMANLELARGARMPEIFYEYNLRNLIARYLPAYSERMAQIIAYGQRLGPRDAPQRMNLWDVARREAEDTFTQEWLKNAEDNGTNFSSPNSIVRSARRAQALASASLLSDPTTTVPRNILTGLAATTEIYGVGRSMRAFKDAMKLSSRLDARTQGAIRDDLASLINADQLGDSALDRGIRTTSNVALKVSGFTPGENFVRTHNSLAASGFARDAAAALSANPASKLSKEALAQFKRWDINPEAIVAEQGRWQNGPETRKYIRTAVREMQGGYRFDQVPQWASSTAGRFFYQYGRWAVQRTQHMVQNIFRQAIGEDVTFRGQRMRHQNLLPLIRAGAFTIGLGETFGAIAFGLFGKDRRDSSLSEIVEAFSEDEKKAVGMLVERMVNDVIMAGTLGLIGQPFDLFKAAKDQSRFKNPANPPSAAGVKAFVELAQRAVDQEGTLTKKDWLDAASRIARGPKNVSDVVRHHLGDSLYEGQNDQRTLRMAALRWAKETKQDVPIRSVTDIRKSPTAPAYEAVNEALLAGNAEAAKKAAIEFIDEAKDKAKARTAVKASVNARHPFRAGNLSSDAHQNEFMRWAEKNLSAPDLEQIKRVQERYEKTASAAGLK